MNDIVSDKQALRRELKAARVEHAASLSPSMRALVFRRPPAPVLTLIPSGASIGLYRASEGEAPATNWAQALNEAGHRIALPRVTSREEEMSFHVHTDPLGESDLEAGPFGLLQPAASAEEIVPDVLVMPLVGFTANGERLGQGGGHYDRWLTAHPATVTIGLAWDVQLVESLPLEAHDQRLNAVVTPTRFYGPFA